MKDEYGYDPDETYSQEDNEFWDGTDYAHPAWWRGDKHGVETLVVKVNEWLDGKFSSGKYKEPIQGLKERIESLVKQKS